MKLILKLSGLMVVLMLASCGGKVTQATCTDSVKKLNITEKATVNCPASCNLNSSVWGSDQYTTDSSICVAAVHAGVIQADAGGKVTVAVEAGKQSYSGSSKNGVTTKNWGPYGQSFTVK